jgi:hypothetical protein
MQRGHDIVVSYGTIQPWRLPEGRLVFGRVRVRCPRGKDSPLYFGLELGMTYDVERGTKMREGH